MAFLPRALPLLLLAVVCIQLSGVLADGRDRCWCLKSLKKRVPREEIEEFSIFPRRSKCDTVEIILTLKPVNKSTEVVQRCLSPETNLLDQEEHQQLTHIEDIQLLLMPYI
ncbi:chemokine (C-X-C motif) ligand 18b isoform X2 [Cyprinus carpio]|uniref:Chemokine (C-X-C motif) ligand 18b isoform X2 n=1 Tax=Cyprinus carpio TaxID=7962 RepID=A0A9R0B101_CYPCA|nr:chemokine (C-X-C motif) ligand 18b isoform X2 [Cyprinus carpio]